MHDFPLKNWIPYKLVKEDGQIYCRWLNTFEKRFTEPFFDETILKCRSTDGKYSLTTSVSNLAMFEEWAGLLSNGMAPDAFIFHISRCGSTLVSQLLATSDEHVVLSEVPFFDDLLRLPYQNGNFSQKVSSLLLVNAFKFYGQKKTGNEQRLFIKADSWHIFFYKQLRQLYPKTPFILLYRSPDDVFKSHKKIPGMQSVPGLIEPEVFGFNPNEPSQWNLNIYLAKVLEKYLDQYHQIIETDERFLLLNYNEGIIPIIQKISSFTNTPLSEESLSIMEERSRYHSKKPGELFSEINPEHTPPILDRAMELYYALEEKRMAIKFIS